MPANRAAHRPPSGLRERQREMTRSTLAAVAERRFREDGFEATTLEDICEEADVSVRTALRYFGRKEDLALVRQVDELEAFRTAIENLGANDDVLGFWRNWVVVRASTAGPARELKAHWRLVESSAALVARSGALQKEHEDLLAKALRGRAGLANDAAGVLAAVLVAAFVTQVRLWAEAGGGGDLAARCLATAGALVDCLTSP